ncbi:MAG TPA: hypothetical protein VNT42_03790, partial [Sphingomonas sp.]|nr:hypothetical protein [Sphingomonas sp.]
MSQGGLDTAAEACVIEGVRIAGIVACVPAQIVANADMTERFGDAVAQVTKMTGVEQRHVADDAQTTADFCAAAAEALLDRLAIERDSIGALIFITQTPDHRLPATAC